MNCGSGVWKAVAVLGAAFFALSVTNVAWAQPAKAPAQSEFTPEVGQPGKDVVWVPTAQTLVNKLLDIKL